MAVFCNPDTVVTLIRPLEMRESLEAEGYVLVERVAAVEPVAVPKGRGKKADSAQ